MQQISAGIIIYKKVEGLFDTEIKFLLVHQGGPFYTNKETGAWSIPKGLTKDDEELIEVAKREFAEETSLPIPETLEYIGFITYKNGKEVHAFAGQNNSLPDKPKIVSNTLEIQWPPRSGKFMSILEVDRGEFFTLEEAKEKIVPAQFELLQKLCYKLVNS